MTEDEKQAARLVAIIVVVLFLASIIDRCVGTMLVFPE